MLSTHELKLLHDRDFLLAKLNIDTKITDLLIAHQREMKDFFLKFKANLPVQLSYTVSKVNKGQNLKGLPYWVIDFPSAFDSDNIFTYRTIVWWGHHISFHLILKGYHFNNVECDFSRLRNKSIFYSINDSPWEVEFEPNNLILVDSLSSSIIKKHRTNAFLKLSAKFSLCRIDELTTLSKSTFGTVLSSLNWLNI